MITILSVAEARGVEPDSEGRYSAGAFANVGLALVGGCSICHAVIAAYNAYPTKTGYWMCGDCAEMSGEAFNSVEEFEKFEVAHA